MAEDLDPKTKLDIYKLVLARYKELISEKESKSISEIRQRVSPYNDFIRRIRDRLLEDIVPYSYAHHFPLAAQKAISYVNGIRTCEFAFSFYVAFPEMEELRIGTAFDKAMLLAALLRALESEDARVLVTRRGRPYVRYQYKGETFVFVPESGSLLAGEDSMKLFSEDPLSYPFSDLVYENHEDR
jgi:hypothetical protein